MSLYFNILCISWEVLRNHITLKRPIDQLIQPWRSVIVHSALRTQH